MWHVVFVQPDIPRRISSGAQFQLTSYMQVSGDHVTVDHVTCCDVTKLSRQLIDELVRRTHNAPTAHLHSKTAACLFEKSFKFKLHALYSLYCTQITLYLHILSLFVQPSF